MMKQYDACKYCNRRNCDGKVNSGHQHDCTEFAVPCNRCTGRWACQISLSMLKLFLITGYYWSLKLFWIQLFFNKRYGFFQLMFLCAVYGYLLFYASNLISDGSELLLLVPSIAGLVGSVVLPILGWFFILPL
jgi:hypothetical protein